MFKKIILGFFLLLFVVSVIFLLIFLHRPSCGEKGNLGNGYNQTLFSIYVYYYQPSFSGCSMGKKKIEGADTSTFQVENRFYSKDKNNVYFFYEIPDTSVVRIKEADPATFEVLTKDSTYYRLQYAKDKNNAYFRDKVIKNADVRTFEMLEYGYSKDSMKVFRETIEITGANSDSFVPIGRYYSKDGDHVYFEVNMLKDADPETFRVMDNFMAKDKNHVYKDGVILEGVDPETFSQ